MAIDFHAKRFYTFFTLESYIIKGNSVNADSKMLRKILAVAIVLLAVGLTLVGFNAIYMGTGLAGARALVHHWRDLALNATDISLGIVVVVFGLVIGSLA